METSGEKQIRHCLTELNIRFKQYVKIGGLKGDTKPHRNADFYLPDYGLYIEYLGTWENPDKIKRSIYRRDVYGKKQAYSKNNIKCIYIYPAHLKSLDFILKREIAKYEKRANQETAEEEPISELYSGHISQISRNKISQIYKRAIILVILISLIIGAVLFFAKDSIKKEMDLVGDNQKKNYVGPDPRYYQIYSNLNMGMSAKDFRTMIFKERFEWNPPLGESKEFELYRFQPDKYRIKVYFNDIAQKEVESTGIIVSPGGNVQTWIFTDAKLIKVELYYNGKIIAEK